MSQLYAVALFRFYTAILSTLFAMIQSTLLTSLLLNTIKKTQKSLILFLFSVNLAEYLLLQNQNSYSLRKSYDSIENCSFPTV